MSDMLEKSVLGGIMLSSDQHRSDILMQIFGTLKMEMFEASEHQFIFSVFKDLYSTNKQIDLPQIESALTAANRLESVGGLSYLAGLIDFSTTSDALCDHVSSLQMRFAAKQFDIAAKQLRVMYSSRRSDSEYLRHAKLKLNELSTTESVSAEFVALDETIYDASVAIASGDKSIGIVCETSIQDVNDIIGGWTATDFFLVGGRPAMGKTSYLLAESMHVAMVTGKPVIYISIEMDNKTIGIKCISNETGISRNELITGVTRDNAGKFEPGVNQAITKTKNVFVNRKSTITVEDMVSMFWQIKAKTGQEPAAIFVDYLQLVRPTKMHKSRESEISEISFSHKQMAMQLKIPVIAGSQLSRELERRDDKRPMLSDLRESGTLEQDASTVMFLYRDSVYNKDSDDKESGEIIVGKNRHGRPGVAMAIFNGVWRSRD